MSASASHISLLTHQEIIPSPTPAPLSAASSAIAAGAKSTDLKKPDTKDSKQLKETKETITAEAVLTLVPAISDVARKTKKDDEKAKALNQENKNAFLDFILFALNTTTHLPHEVIDLMLQCLIFKNQLFYDMSVTPAYLSTHGFFTAEAKGLSNAMVVAEQISLAAPLEQIEAQIIANPKILITIFRLNYHLEGMPEPLVIEGIPEQIAIILLDISLRSPGNHSIIDEGLANLLRRLRVELLPDTLPLAAQQAAFAAPVLDEKAEQAIDDEQLPILNKAFDFIKADNADAAVKAVRDYIKSIKPEVITNYIYFLKLLRLLGNAYNVLAKRGWELEGGWESAQGSQYCFKVIGLAIEMEFGERMRQRLESRIGEFQYYDHVAPRTLVNTAKSHSSFLRNQDGSKVLGDSFYHDIYAPRRGSTRSGRGGPKVFSYYTTITSAMQSLYVGSQNQLQARPLHIYRF